MRKNIIYILAIYCLLISNSSLASQIKIVEGGSEFTAQISKYDINRIKVAGDRIRSVKNNVGELEISRDDRLGEIYVRTTALTKNKPVNLFIVTEQNFTYQALLYPKSIPSEQIIIRNEDVVASSDSEVARISKNSYEKQVITLLKAMRLKQKLDGFNIKRARRYVNLGDLGMRRISSYKGQNFIGEIFTLKNTTRRIVNLDEKLFFKNGVRAIKIEKRDLLPGEITEIFVVS